MLDWEIVEEAQKRGGAARAAEVAVDLRSRMSPGAALPHLPRPTGTATSRLSTDPGLAR